MTAGRIPSAADPRVAISRQLAMVYAEVDVARAVYRGVALIGHRRSIEAGEMVWAMPGCGMVYQTSLIRDMAFQLITAPPSARLVQLQAKLARIRAQAARQGEQL